MKIALLAPAGAMHRYNGSFKRSLHYAPLTLVTLAGLVPPELEADIRIYDETAGPIPRDLDADLIGITAITGTCRRAYAYADYFRGRGKTVVLGGVHTSLMPQEAAEHADAIVTGFAEQTWPQLLRDYRQGQLKTTYRQNGDFSIAGRPLPRWDLLNPKRYATLNTVEAIRGCHLICSFCAYPAAFGKPIYKRPIREVISEIEQMKGKEVCIPDINIIADHEYACELFREMAPLKKWWFGLATSDVTQNKKLFKLMVKSGCRGLLIGMESVNHGSQKFVKKSVNKVGGYENLAKELHDAGIAINGCFAFGGDEDGLDVFKRTVDAVVHLKIDLPRFSILTPFPGTELYRQMERQGRIIEHHFAMYDVEHCVFQPKNMTRQQLYEGIEWAWRATYNALNIAKRLATFGTPHIFTVPANIFGYRNYAQKFRRFDRQVMTDNSDVFVESDSLRVAEGIK